MKQTQYLMSVSFIVLASFLLPGSATAASFSEIKKAGVLRMATEGVAPPFNFYEGKTLTGFEVELANEMAKKLELKPDWKTLSFDSLLIGLGQDHYDVVVASHAVTEERKKAVDFVNPHYCSGAVLISKKGGPTHLKDLHGKVVSAQLGSIYPKFLEDMKVFKEVKTFPKDTDLIQSVLQNKVDAAVTDKFLMMDIIRKQPKLGIQMGDIVNLEHNAMAVSKGNIELRDKLNSLLRQMMNDGTYAKISKKYFGEDVRCKD